MRTLSREEVRAIDHRAINVYGVPGVVLMENAGAGAARLLSSRGISGAVVIVCGKGNNGGDGFVIARHLDLAGHPVRLLLACQPDEIRGDAAVNLQIAKRAGLPIASLAGRNQDDWEAAVAGADWIVDALLGTGASGPPTGTVAVAITAINAIRDRTASCLWKNPSMALARECGPSTAHECEPQKSQGFSGFAAAASSGGSPYPRAASRVMAVDLPSGLDCDTGQAVEPCIRADLTATFVAPKRGFETAAAAASTGRVEVIGIGAPRAAMTG